MFVDKVFLFLFQQQRAENSTKLIHFKRLPKYEKTDEKTATARY